MFESLLASVVLAMCVLAVTMPFTAAIRNDEVQQGRTAAAMLGQALMEEILARPFYDPQGASDPGPETGETSRTLFDNIDDYHSFSEAANNLTDFAGNAITDPAARNLSRQVATEYVYVSGQPMDQPPTFIRVTVVVSEQGTPMVTLKRLVYAGY